MKKVFNFKINFLNFCKQLQEEWRIVFYVSMAIFLIGFVISSIFTSGETEQWALGEDLKTEEIITLNKTKQ